MCSNTYRIASDSKSGDRGPGAVLWEKVESPWQTLGELLEEVCLRT